MQKLSEIFKSIDLSKQDQLTERIVDSITAELGSFGVDDSKIREAVLRGCQTILLEGEIAALANENESILGCLPEKEHNAFLLAIATDGYYLQPIEEYENPPLRIKNLFPLTVLSANGQLLHQSTFSKTSEITPANLLVRLEVRSGKPLIELIAVRVDGSTFNNGASILWIQTVYIANDTLDQALAELFETAMDIQAESNQACLSWLKNDRMGTYTGQTSLDKLQWTPL